MHLKVEYILFNVTFIALYAILFYNTNHLR